jgi:hypothetical protein
MAHHWLPLLNGSFATRLRFSKMTDRYRVLFDILSSYYFKRSFSAIFTPFLEDLLRCFYSYSVFQGFRQAKSANGGSILSSSQFLILPQLPQKIKLASKVVKVDSKISISLPKI